MGGLGNQMFQYAIGRRIALLNQSQLKLDLHFLNDKTHKKNFTIRNYELAHFNINAITSNYKEFAYFYNNDIYSRLKRRFGSIKLIKEQGLKFVPEILNLKGNIYLDGYWQCEKYFESIRSILLDDFKLKPALIAQMENNIFLSDIKSQIISNNSIAVHFRRGDYVTNAVINQQHGTCNIQYYREAIKYISGRIENPHFYLFSDDPDWLANQNIAEGYPTTLVASSNMHLDMYLMSLCQHNIIANSSFSWWGAWLNVNEEKIVIAPKQWFANQHMNNQAQDLIPEKWIKL